MRLLNIKDPVLPDSIDSLSARARDYLASQGAPSSLIEARALALFPDASHLVVADVSRSGREHLLIPAAAHAWRALRNAAAAEGVALIIVSAFRSFERQAELVGAKLAAGRNAAEVFATSAPPGCSEHHTGCAVDIGTLGCEPVSLDFEGTPAFEWLQANAARFGFLLSYPPGNRFGFDYEPWHWCYQPQGDAAAG